MTQQDRPDCPWLEEFRKASGHTPGAMAPAAGRVDDGRRPGAIARVFHRWKMALYGVLGRSTPGK
jgi:hypothetical protein